jgi:hypothetical protein
MVVAAPLENDLKRHLGSVCLLLCLAGGAALAETQIVIVEGLGGEPRFTEAFAEQVDTIATASRALVPDSRLHVIRVADAGRDAILSLFAKLAATSGSDDALLLYLIGHGSFDEHDYKFNVPGPDLTGADIASLLDAHAAGMQLLVNTSSASGVLNDLLQNERRILILATRSGSERHATRFGDYFAAALADTAADVDKNQTITAGEAFRFAERLVTDYYARNNQLATEHSQLTGERADRVVLARLVSAPLAIQDDELAALLAERQSMNDDIAALRLQRDAMAGDDYQAELLRRLLELARLEDRIEARQEAVRDAD